MAMKRLRLGDLINRADIGVIQSRSGTGLASEALQNPRVVGDQLREKLQRDETTEFSVLGLVDHTHPAAAQLLDNAVVRDGLTDHR